ncbi:FecCD family ABC transporter permease [Radicibacter daui]|uniref:FecCD family ABC transporter permease n=1 Tax=Radicibacter daui TaxID=3064829 RepID=UPI004046F364
MNSVPPSSAPAGRRRLPGTGFVLVSGCAALLVLCLLSLAVGVRSVPLPVVVDALTAYDGRLPDHIAVLDYRLPRTLLGLLCGAAFALAGALIQATTRNPLADPGLLGVNAGAAFAVTLAVGLFGFQLISLQLWFAFAGAVAAALLVYAIGMASRDGATPIRLLLAGVATTAVLHGFGSAIALFNPLAFDSMRLWMLGALAGRDMATVSAAAPFIAAGLLIALSIAPALNALALGDSLARGLGTRVVRTRLLAGLAITLLAGAGTAAVGPIGFIGLMTPHAARWLLGPDQRRILPGSLVFGPCLLLAADVAGRLLLQPGELEAGVVTAFLGAPLLIALVRRQKASAL